ncbi:MAG: LysR substrate-binding domain-containing protein [Marinosulfonomonas sp.]|nr:LysR substrate-binding domain-containing protein [Marinosulfonomonas sp.]
MAIRYGNGVWPGYQCELLISANFVVVASRGYIGDREIGSLNDLVDDKWLIEADRRELLLWVSQHGFDLESLDTTEFPTATLVHIAARAGYGVAIMVDAVVERDLEDGALVNLFSAESGILGYYLVTRKEAASDKLAVFIKWLKRCK